MASTSIDLLAPVHRLTPAQFLRMGELGLFDQDERVELIDGVVLAMSPIGRQHARAVMWLTRTLDRQLDDDTFVSVQNGVMLQALGSVPQPDLALVSREDVATDLPDRPMLVIEVSHTSLAFDRVTKARRYAQHGVPEYWIVNLVDGVIEVHREPSPDGWGTSSSHAADQTLEVQQLPGLTVELAPLFAFVG